MNNKTCFAKIQKTILSKSIRLGKFVLIGAGLLTATWACRPKTLSETELLAYVKESANGLSKTYNLKPYEVTATLRPTDLVVQQLTDQQTTAKQKDSLQKVYAKYWYFNVGFSADKQDLLNVLQVQNYSKFSEILQVISYRMPTYAYLTTSQQDTIPLADYSYLRLYGMTRSTDVLLVFDKQKAQQTDWVQLNINEFGAGIGDVRLRFNTKDLESTPKLQ